MTDNPSFVMKSLNQVVFEERPIPEIGDHEVLIEVKKTGICGSDIHFLVHGRIGDFIVENPMVLGHESSGVISKAGSKVKNVKVGDKVVMEPGYTCRTCEDCKRGRYELCPDVVFAATPPYDGTLARYFRLPSDMVYPLPAHLTLEEGAMMEPLSVAIHAVANVADLHANKTVAVFGCGPVGLVCMAVSKALGASRVVAIDIVPARLEFAKSYAATDTFKPPPMEPGQSKMLYSQNSAALMKQQLGLDKGIDLVVDASGAEVSIQTGMFIAKAGGTYVQVGMGTPEVMVPITLMLTKEINFKGSFRYGPGDYALAVALAGQGKVDLKPLITHRFAFTDAAKAFEVTRAGKSEDGKPVIKSVISGPDVPAGPL